MSPLSVQVGQPGPHRPRVGLVVQPREGERFLLLGHLRGEGDGEGYAWGSGSGSGSRRVSLTLTQGEG